MSSTGSAGRPWQLWHDRRGSWRHVWPCFVVLTPAVVELAFGPVLALALLIGVAGCIAIAQSPLARFVFIILGAILTFQSTSNLLKFGFLALAAVCLLFAVRELLRPENRELVAAWRPFIVMSGWTFTYLALTGPLAITRGASIVDWARDVAPLLFATTLPLIGLEAGIRIRHSTILRIFVGVGVVSTASFVVQWLTNREVSGVGRLTYGDNYLTAGLFCLCIAVAAGGDRRILGQFSGAGLFGAVLLTGNRSLLALILGFLGVVGGVSRRRMPVGRLARAGLWFVISLIVVVELAIVFIPGERALLTQRVEVTQAYIATGQDQSSRSRARQTNLAEAQFVQHPVFGSAPGHRYTDPYYLPGVSDPRRNRGAFFTLDTPLAIPAKFGVFGTLLIAIWLLVLGTTVARWIRNRRPSVIGNALRAFACISLGLLPFGISPEQKGFAIIIMLFLAALISHDQKDGPGANPAASEESDRPAPTLRASVATR